MISVIYGAKGTGKTKHIIDAANSCGEKATGTVIYITDNTQSVVINPGIKFINLNEYAVRDEQQFIGFIKGMLAANFDIQDVFIDGISRFIAKPADELKNIFEEMAKLAGNVNFVLTVSTDKLPAFLKQYAAKG